MATANSDHTLRIILRAPATTLPKTFVAPSIQFMSGTWHVTHSTLPMWSKSRNVRITYAALPMSNADSTVPKLNDLVEYQSLTSDKLKTVEGVDTPASDGAWDWRGKGWLMIASSHWEVLGYGEYQDEAWMVTYFAKTLFTPAGLDIYSRRKEGLSNELLASVMDAVAKVDVEGFKTLSNEMFTVKSDFY